MNGLVGTKNLIPPARLGQFGQNLTIFFVQPKVVQGPGEVRCGSVPD